MKGKALFRLLKMKFKRSIPSSVSKVVKYGAIGTLAGGAAASVTAAGHSRTEDIKKGLMVGGMVGLGSFVAPKILRNTTVRRMMRSAGQQLKKEARVRGKIVFRRVRGRIIPIGKK